MNDELNRGENLREPQQRAGRYKQKSLPVIYLRNSWPVQEKEGGKEAAPSHLATSGWAERGLWW